MADDLLTIGQLAALSGRSRRTLDYYSRSGLLPFERSEGGRRLYRRSVVDQLHAIGEYQAARLTLDEIRTRFESPDPAPAARVAAIDAELSRLSAEVARLKVDAPAEPEVQKLAARSAAHALALAQALLLLVPQNPF
jgi:DNA-binding transcriptional MerR regulator